MKSLIMNYRHNGKEYKEYDEALIKASLTKDHSMVNEWIEQTIEGVKSDCLRFAVANEPELINKFQQMIADMPSEFHEEFVEKLTEVLPINISQKVFFSSKDSKFVAKSNKEIMQLVKVHITNYTSRKNALREYVYASVQHNKHITLIKVTEAVACLVKNESDIQKTLMNRKLKDVLSFMFDIPPIYNMMLAHILVDEDEVNDILNTNDNLYTRLNMANLISARKKVKSINKIIMHKNPIKGNRKQFIS